MDYQVALCGLSELKARHLRIVVSLVPAAKNTYHFGMTAALPRVDLVLVNLLDEKALGQLAEIRKKCPTVVAVFISEDGTAGDTRYRIAASSLLLRIRELLEFAVSENISGVGGAPAARPAKSELGPKPILTAELRLQGSANSTHLGRTETGSQPAAEVYSGRPKALVVDDSAAIRVSVHAALQLLGVDSIQVTDAAQALALLKNSKFDLALLDVVMPSISGYELCRRIKHDRQLRRMPVIMLTSKSSPFDRARGAFAGCDSYLAKPLNKDALAHAVNRSLKRVARYERRQSQSPGAAFLPLMRRSEGQCPSPAIS